MNINRDYLIINDVKKSNIKLDNGSMFFYITDKNTQNIFVNLVINISNNDLIQKYANIENAEDYTLTMNIVKPDNTYKVIEGKLHDKEKAIFEFDLKEDCVDKIGTYRCELLTKCNINDHEEITTSNKLTYKVKSSVLNDLDEIVEAPEYPLVIQLFDKLSDIEQYEEDRRANELARQLAEEQRRIRFDALDADVTDSIQAMDDKVVEVENRISAKEQAVDKLIVDTKADIDDYKVAKDTEIDEYKATKDTEINNAITAQDNKIDEAITNQNNKIDDAVANQNNKIDTAIAEQNNRIEIVEASDNTQNTRLDALEAKDIAHETSITNIEAKNVEQDNRLDNIEAVNVSQGTRLDAIEIKNQQQDDRLLDAEKVNKRQDMDLKCLFAESKNNMIDITEEGNSIYLQNSTVGYTLIDEIQGNTMVNCNKEADKEIILNGNINTQGYSNVTLTEGVDGGLVDVALEGNTMVNVCDQKDPVAITKSYIVETGNHVALQGEYDGKCRPVVTGNTLWIDNDTEEVLTEFDNSKNLRLQSSFEDKVVTQEMVDAGEEVAENLGKYKVDYVISKEDGTVGFTKTFYLNSPLLEGDTIEQQGDNVVHVHTSELRAYETDDELTLPTDMINTLVSKSPQYEVISTNDIILCDSYVNGHLDVDSVVPIKRVEFGWWLHDNKYVYPSTNYVVQFEADNVGKIDEMYFNGGEAKNNIAVVKGLNRIILTTNSTTTNFSARLNIRGIGFNASNIVVTPAIEQDFGYFEGMKSVGECEDLEVVSRNSDGTLSNTQTLTHEPLRAVGDIKDKYVLIDGKWYIDRNCGVRAYQEGDKDNYITDMVNTVYPLSSPTYEPIDYNPFTVYSDVTHISNNSTIPCNMTIKNTGFNCLLKPSTTYTVSSNLGLNTVTTPSILTEDCLHFYDTDTSDVTTMKDVLVLEGDYTTGKPIPSHFSGIESVFEQEHDEAVGKYKVKIRVQNEDASKENYIEFYINEPLRGIRDVKDKVYIKNDKVVVERNCGSVVLDGSENIYLHQPSNTNLLTFRFGSVGNNAIANQDIYSNNFITNNKSGLLNLDNGCRITSFSGLNVLFLCIKKAKLQTQDLEGFRQWLQQNPTTVVYQLAEPTYEEVEYNDVKLFIESFKNSTLFYNSNIPVTSKVWYSYSIPLVDTVAQTADISDQQDSMIIDLATQVSVMEMMLM